jgi:hypothetical protein
MQKQRNLWLYIASVILFVPGIILLFVNPYYIGALFILLGLLLLVFTNQPHNNKKYDSIPNILRVIVVLVLVGVVIFITVMVILMRNIK